MRDALSGRRARDVSTSRERARIARSAPRTETFNLVAGESDSREYKHDNYLFARAIKPRWMARLARGIAVESAISLASRETHFENPLKNLGRSFVCASVCYPLA